MFAFTFEGNDESESKVENKSHNYNTCIYIDSLSESHEINVSNSNFQLKFNSKSTDINNNLRLTYCQYDYSKYGNTDLIKGVYEGGEKVWECSIDLAQYIMDHVPASRSPTTKCLELGCGHGLPGICALLLGYQVTFTDYNDHVITLYTIPNIYLNTSIILHPRQSHNLCTLIVNKCINTTTTTTNNNNNNNSHHQHNVLLQHEGNEIEGDPLHIVKECHFYSGDWIHMSSSHLLDTTITDTNIGMKQKYDLILSAETLYNTDVCTKVVYMIQEHLSIYGQAILATKKYYFGVGGGTQTFLDILQYCQDHRVRITLHPETVGNTDCHTGNSSSSSSTLKKTMMSRSSININDDNIIIDMNTINDQQFNISSNLQYYLSGTTVHTYQDGLSNIRDIIVVSWKSYS